MTRGEALEVLPEVLDEIAPGCTICVFHSAALAYFPPDDRDRFVSLLKRASMVRPLVWLSFESPFIAPFDELDAVSEIAPPHETYFVLGCTRWDRGERSDSLLARGDPHGRWAQWLGPTE